MRGKFNYLIFFLRLIFAAVFLVCSIAALIMGPREWFGRHDLSGAIGITFTLLLLLSFANFKISRAVWTKRFTIRVEVDRVMITDLILFKRRVLRREDIKGFSLSEYPLRGINFKSILLYLDNGQKVELPQFLFLNFKQLTRSLQESGIKFLGEEPYIWKWIDSRYYKFDK